MHNTVMQRCRQERGHEMATNKEIVENAYASFATGDVPAALGAMADDIQWTEADGFPLAGTYVVLRRCSKECLYDWGKSVMTSRCCRSSSSPTVRRSWPLGAIDGRTR